MMDQMEAIAQQAIKHTGIFYSGKKYYRNILVEQKM
jgi:hypothetical protein